MALGTPVTVERLSGMSLSGVWRVRGAARSLIVKSSRSADEARFYSRVAPSLRSAGIPIPELEIVLHESDAHWLVIEDIPEPLPATSSAEWAPDPRVVAILARLHARTRAKPPDLPEPPTRGWTGAMTQAALSCLPAASDRITPLLERLRRESQPVFDPWCWISGDPNPRNWGLRAGGTPVLFDWELFGPGTPATDLSIIVPGLGDRGTFDRVATAYLAAWSGPDPLPWDTATLARQIALAKVATVVQLLAGHASGSARVGDDLLAWLTRSVPDWLHAISL